MESDSPFNYTNLYDLGLLRIKSHCSYDTASINSSDYSIFQIEIQNEDLIRDYQGKFILEVWNKQGERLYQKILQEECTKWKLYSNVLVFKSANDSPIINIIWLHERKMTSIKHPFGNNQEIDFIYFDGYLVIAGQNNIKAIQIGPNEVQTSILQFMLQEGQIQIIEKEGQGIICENIISLFKNPNKHELIIVCFDQETSQAVYKKFIAKPQEKRVLLDKLVIEEAQQKKQQKLDKRQKALLAEKAHIQQIQVINKNQKTYLLILNSNEVFYIVENFTNIIYVEKILKLQKLLPSHGENITYQFEDGQIGFAVSLDKPQERFYINEHEYLKKLTLPCKNANQNQQEAISDIHRQVHFFQDMITINQSVFLLRDNVIFVIDITDPKKLIIESQFNSKSKIIGLYKIKKSADDEQGYKTFQYKIVAVSRNGILQVYSPKDSDLLKGWDRQEIQNTVIFQQKDQIQSAFQNQATFSSIYISALTAAGDQKIYQIQISLNISELIQKMPKNDSVFCVNTVPRTLELIGIIDQKNLSIYKNDNSNLSKLFEFNLIKNELKDSITGNSIFFFNREFVLVITNDKILKINKRSGQVSKLFLKDTIYPSLGNCFLDNSYFYFISKEDNGESKLALVSLDMIDAAFIQAQNEGKDQVINLEKGKNQSQTFFYPDWQFQNNPSLKRLDYDEFNSQINILHSNLEIISLPLLHRNTIAFQGMAERKFYLAFRSFGNLFYALDKQNFMNCWSKISGQLIFRNQIQYDYKDYEIDRQVYDKNWFNYTLIHKQDQQIGNEENFNWMLFKIIQIDEKGNVQEKLTYSFKKSTINETHFYFNSSFNKMVEITIINDKRNVTYNLYQLPNQLSQAWEFVKTLSSKAVQSNIEWHHKSLYPYNLNLKTFENDNSKQFQNYEIFKQLKQQNMVKVLNLKDGVEMIINSETGKIENFLSLMYQFQTIQDSFYDNKSGQQFVSDIIERLQNFYENNRRNIFLKNKPKTKIRQLDISARNFKHKYIIEQSFTYLDYKFFNQHLLQQQENLSSIFTKMSEQHAKKIIHNIFPCKNNTILHFFAANEQGYLCIDYLRLQAKLNNYVIPFLTNLDEQTPLDIAVNLKDTKQCNSIVRMLSKTPMDHHSRFITHLMPSLIDLNLPALDKYFDKRQYQTGFCKQLTVGRISVFPQTDFKAVASTLTNENVDSIRQTLINNKYKESSINLQIVDLPLTSSKVSNVKAGEKQLKEEANQYEISLVYSLAQSENDSIFQQKTIRAFIDFIWPKAKSQIIKNLFLPYLAFILYYMIFLIVLKKMNITQLLDPAFFSFTSNMFKIYDFMFKLILFLGCCYFFLYHDMYQIKNVTNNKIVLWSYANAVPLVFMIFIIIYDTFLNSEYPQLEKTFYSLSAFFIWIRVLHLLKCFYQTAYLLRMGFEIIYRMRFLITFIVISLLSFGFTFYFLSDSGEITPQEGIVKMFLVLVGNYDASEFDNIYLQVLYVIVNCINFFFIFTLLVALSVAAFSNESHESSNEAYQEKASIIALYSYLLTEKAVRDPNKKYLLIATVSDHGRHCSNSHGGMYGGKSQQTNQNDGKSQSKLMKTIDRKFNSLATRFEKSLKEIQERLDNIDQNQLKKK